jgi:ubiquitin-like modifier-activating enzyme ATG7
MLNHPLKNGAKANEEARDCDRSELGIIPQQIRGDLSLFGINVMYGEAFDRCIGCSSKIVESYLEDKQGFVMKACNRPDYLEDLTGITEMLQKVNLDDIEGFDFDEDMAM